MKNVATKTQWLAARQAHLEKEKAFTKLRDELSAERRELPWLAVSESYEFHSVGHRHTLADLFENRSQLIVFHFMFAEDWDEGCPSCSFWADNFNGIDVHLAHRDIALVAVSNTSVEKIEQYKRRMGWTFRWVSSLHSSFNRDFDVSFSSEDVRDGRTYYNYRTTAFPSTEAPGISVFAKEADGSVFHTYSCYSRGLDMLNAAYHLMDLVPAGRAEASAHPMSWLRRRDQYED
ncbi:MAG: DUF899 family protein [Gammaproteobacteria bacterium]|nr:DUF899 family protein [Gammaproteobacteria bacterium]